MATWPGALPGPQAGYSSTDGSNALSRKTQSGRVEIRRYGSGAPAVGSYVWKLTPEQKAVFDRFYRVDLNWGVNWFSAPWISDLGYQDHKAKIAGYVPIKGQKSGRTEYSVTLHIKKSSACPVDDTVWPVGV